MSTKRNAMAFRARARNRICNSVEMRPFGAFAPTSVLTTGQNSVLMILWVGMKEKIAKSTMTKGQAVRKLPRKANVSDPGEEQLIHFKAPNGAFYPGSWNTRMQRFALAHFFFNRFPEGFQFSFNSMNIQRFIRDSHFLSAFRQPLQNARMRTEIIGMRPRGKGRLSFTAAGTYFRLAKASRIIFLSMQRRRE